MRHQRRTCWLFCCCLLLLAALPPLTSADEQLTWNIPYPYNPNSHYPLPDYLPGYLGIARADLTAETILQVSLAPEGDRWRIVASFTAGDREVRLTGQGDFGYYQESPLQTGQFVCQTAEGVDCTLYLSVYAPSDEQTATILLGENTPQVTTLTFGLMDGNMSAISTQVDERLKNQAKPPSAYQLDGQELMLQPAPLIVDNQVLVPARPLLCALGAQVTWNAASQEIIAVKGDLRLALSLSDQSLRVNAGARQPLLVYRAANGQTFCPLSPVASALGASVLNRRAGTVSLISRERTDERQGRLQFIFLSLRNLIIQNDTNLPMNLSGWALISLDPQAGPGPMQEFRFPDPFILPPGQQVQVSDDLITQPDNRLLFDWAASPGSPDVRPPMQLLISSLRPGEENIVLQTLGSDQYLGNWRLVNAAGKPALDLPDRWLAESTTFLISGRPGEPTNVNELRWPNLPDVEAAYQAELVLQAERAQERHQQLVELYAPLTEALGLTDSGYYFYSELETGNQLLNGELVPLVGQRAPSRALYFVEARLLRPLIEAGCRVPVFYISPDGQTAYIGMIKADGSLVAYRLQQVIDGGYYTWSYQQVLPE